MMVMKTNLKEYRDARNMSQEDLAIIVGTRRESICRLERCGCKCPSYETLYRISKYFGVAVQELFWYEEE